MSVFKMHALYGGGSLLPLAGLYTMSRPQWQKALDPFALTVETR